MNKSRIASIGAGVLAAAGVGFGLVSPAGAEVASYSPPSHVQASFTGTIDAKGAVVHVPVTVVCNAGSWGYLDVHVNQKAGGDIAAGSAYTRITCTGAMQVLDMTITADNQPFKQGPGYVQASLDWSYYGYQTDEHGIDLVK